MHTDSEQYKMGATGWHSISEYQKTKNNIKNKGSTHSPLLPPWWACGVFFFIPRKQKSLCPSPANSARLQDLAYFSSLWLSVTVTKLTTRWEGSRELPGESAVMVVVSSDSRKSCMCHVFGTPSPKNPWPSTLFLSHNQPPTKQGPLIHVCYEFLSPRW